MLGDRAPGLALEVAYSLAAEHHASITVLTVIEVPQHLPLDAYLIDEEANARRQLGRAKAIAADYGVAVTLRSVRARDAAVTILEAIDGSEADLVVIGAERRTRQRGRVLQHVLRRSSCPVVLVSAPSG
jgi:nucleotide-binding universal stress UspA family protein